MRLRSLTAAIFAACVAIIVIPQQVFARQPIPLSQPNGLIFDDEGDLYVANAGSNQILIYDARLVQKTSLTISAGLDFPVRLAFDPFAAWRRNATPRVKCCSRSATGSNTPRASP